jgi:hypothetical protein
MNELEIEVYEKDKSRGDKRKRNFRKDIRKKKLIKSGPETRSTPDNKKELVSKQPLRDKKKLLRMEEELNDE